MPSTGPAGESYYDREMRLRREAEERLRAKFGAGGLKGQSVSNSGGMGYTPSEASSTEYGAWLHGREVQLHDIFCSNTSSSLPLCAG